MSCATNGSTRTICVCPFMASHDALTSLSSQSRKFSCILCTWRTGFRVARRAWRSRVRIPGRRFDESRRVEGSLRGFPGGPRSLAGSRADEVDRTVPEVDQCGAVSEHFCTASSSVQFGTVRALLSSKLIVPRLSDRPHAREGAQANGRLPCVSRQEWQ